MSIVYVPCIKNGMNDIKALLNLKEESSGYVMPLVLTAGTPYPFVCESWINENQS